VGLAADSSVVEAIVGEEREHLRLLGEARARIR